MIVLSLLFLVFAVGLLPAFWVVYFRNGLSIVKSRHGIDWREFFMSNLGFWASHWMFWPVGLIQWFSQGKPAKSLAVVALDGREVRQFVSTDRYAVADGVATTLTGK